MKVNVLERIMALNVIEAYKEGNFATFKIIKGLKEKLFINEKEIKEFDFKVEEGNYHWNEEGNKEREIELTEGESKLIKEQLIKMDGENRLTPNHLSLYEKFINPE